MNLEIENKVVLVTGSSKGIGKKIASVLDNERCIVILNSRNENDLELVKKELGSKTSFLVGDVTVKQDCENMLASIRKKFGRLDLLVCNVGSGKLDPTIDEDLQSKIKELCIHCDVTNKNSIIKIRYVDNRSGQMVLRVDTNDECSQIDEGIRMNICNNHYMGYNFDAMLISDYNKGFLTYEDIEKICLEHNNVFLDTKKYNFGDRLPTGLRFLKVNEYELDQNPSFKLQVLADEPSECKEKIIVTLGANGCLYNGKTYKCKTKRDARDLSGAGDTFLSALVVSLLKNDDIDEAIEYANECATRVVQQKGVNTINDI